MRFDESRRRDHLESCLSAIPSVRRLVGNIQPIKDLKAWTHTRVAPSTPLEHAVSAVVECACGCGRAASNTHRTRRACGGFIYGQTHQARVLPSMRPRPKMVPASASQVRGALPELRIVPLSASPGWGHCRARERSGAWRRRRGTTRKTPGRRLHRRRATVCTLTFHNGLSQGVGRTGGVLPEPAAARLPSAITAASSTARLGRCACRAALEQPVGQQVTSAACALCVHNRALSTPGV